MTANANAVRCIELVELITDWMDDALADDVRVQVEEHIAICPNCAEYLDQLRTTGDLLASLGGTPSERRADRRLLEAVRRARRPDGP